MAASQTLPLSSLNIADIPIQVIDTGENKIQESAVSEFDYSRRGQWLRAAVLGANDGLVSVASLMMGVGSVKEDVKAMVIAGFAGLVAGACSMAIGEFVSVCTQRDVEIAQMKREKLRGSSGSVNDGKLPNPVQAAIVSALAFAVGAVLPLLAAAFIRQRKVRIAVVVVVASVALVVFGVVGGLLGGTPVAKSGARVVVGGWMAMGTTFGLTKLLGLDHEMQV
ncbi:hypothetical protein like AT3G43660 [Hibiscus trionum]|uniref:Vacuolar iron transporter n=1 Tax=Hibiscus trionum TaxID=183268 RepID=A0A9W7IVP2_HIBTR|nr:hypothetical protein like AT3G43660 [Hibiscus trionum]